MLQVLCQILQTENINEIQSWLVSSGPNGLFRSFFLPSSSVVFSKFSRLIESFFLLEKEAVRQLITKAIKGLEENGRIPSSTTDDENAKAVQVNMDTFGSLLAAK